ncbi:hypothetical protein JTE90_021299 [Oedothorax gibbosus]|uniref:Uncharacterized protein n=1 Tax=Oedothorax gibbosus TaxID=931172 RepID=A0AAV6VLU9_9ARAC|nr:hypothetical protein JTE90_021299 [Oedothorax gibbosus]
MDEKNHHLRKKGDEYQQTPQSEVVNLPPHCEVGQEKSQGCRRKKYSQSSLSNILEGGFQGCLPGKYDHHKRPLIAKYGLLSRIKRNPVRFAWEGPYRNPNPATMPRGLHCSPNNAD